MSHEFESGFFAGQPAWHDLGTNVEECQNVKEAFRLSQLDWEVSLSPLFLPDGTQLTSHKATIRESDKSILGVVPATYVPFQNSQAFEFLDQTIANGEALFETAGSLQQGSRIFVLCRLPKNITITKHDEIAPYFLACNSHDATLAVRIFPTSIRVVCKNTLSIALHTQKAKESEKQATGLNVRHTKRLNQRIEQGKDYIRSIVEAYKLFVEQAKFLQSKQISEPQLFTFWNSVFAPPSSPENQAETKEQLIEKIKQAATKQSPDYLTLINRLANWKDVSSVQERHHRERLNTLQEIYASPRNEGLVGSTYWAALNAVTEYVDHHQNTRGANEAQRREARFTSLLFGPKNTIKTQALETALSLAS